MAASPVTGERPTGFRRSSSQFASLPQRSLSFHEKVGLAKDDAAADVLYNHPSVRIYSFQPPTDALNSLDKTKKTLPDADYPIDAIEILPWRARTETLAARGKLIIEKVQGSANFLKAGDLIHTIMKNSQCWCVDGESKFVMRIRKLKYLRIEMPTTNAEEKQKVEEFKEVIGKILKFEKTPCPFIRDVHVDLPEDAITPRRRGTWKRKDSVTSITNEEDSRPVRRTKTARTMSMRAMPPSSFPSRSMTQLDMERPRTASTPTAAGRFSFPDMRIESPISYTSGDDNTDSDRHDSESDRPETGHSSEIDESDREISSVPIIKSPLNNVQTLSPVLDHDPSRRDSVVARNRALIEEQLRPAVVEPTASFKEYKLGGTGGGASIAESKGPNQATTKIDPSPRTTTESVTAPDIEDPISTTDSTGIRTTELPEPIEAPSVVQEEVSQMLPSPPPVVEAKKNLETSTIEQRDLSSLEVQNTVEPAPIENAVEKAIETNAGDGSLPTFGLQLPEMNTQTSMEPEIPNETTSTSIKEHEPTVSSGDLAPTKTNDDVESIVSSDSFHTLLSDDETSSSQPTSLGTRPFKHRREISELTVTAASVHDRDEETLPPVDDISEQTVEAEASDPFNDEQPWPEMRTPGAFTDEFEIRKRLKHRRSLSPLPPASILQSTNQMEYSSPLPAELLQKAATMAVVKPLEVIVFVMQVLGRIAGGATMNDLVSGDLFRRPGVRRTASGTFDQDVRGKSTARDSEDEDDFGIPVSGRRKSSTKGAGKPGFTLDHEIDDAASFASID